MLVLRDESRDDTNDLGQTFTYDVTGQQTMASYNGYSLAQSYDGEGLRMKKVANGVTTLYLRSSVLGGQVVAEMSSTGVWTRGYVYLGSQLLAVQQQSAVNWMHEDPVTKSKRVTNGAGAVVSIIETDPWGADTARSNNAAFQPRKFTSYDRDQNGTDEAMFRRYNRWQSRFDQPDPYDGSYNIADPQSFNRYAYVQNDPVNFVDPSGLCGVNPLTGTEGFQRNPMGETGHLREPRAGQGQFHAPRGRGLHQGLDIAGELNVTPVLAFLAGRVDAAGWGDADSGYRVRIDHGNGLVSRYAHLERGSIPAGITPGTAVEQGQELGRVGNTGNAGGTPPHLHFNVVLNRQTQDPENFLNDPCPPGVGNQDQPGGGPERPEGGNGRVGGGGGGARDIRPPFGGRGNLGGFGGWTSLDLLFLSFGSGGSVSVSFDGKLTVL